MDDLNKQMDVVSERLVAVDGAPSSTSREFADNTKTSDEKGHRDRTVDERPEILVRDYRYLADSYQKGIDIFGREGDALSNDIFTSFKTDTEKRVWMLQAELGKAPEVDV